MTEQLKVRSNIIMPWGASLKMYYRDQPNGGFNDWNVIESGLCQDEYMIDRLPLDKGGKAIDLGAHLGSVTIRMASKGMKVYAVEALPENVKLLQDNVRVNNLDQLVKVYPYAVGANDTDKLYAHYGDKTNANGRHHRYIGFVDSSPHPQEGVDIVEIGSVSLDTIFRENNIEHCDIVKADCEGGEWPAFEAISAENLSKIEWILAEIHPFHNYQPNKFIELLHGMFDEVSRDFAKDANSPLPHYVFRRKYD